MGFNFLNCSSKLIDSITSGAGSFAVCSCSRITKVPVMIAPVAIAIPTQNFHMAINVSALHLKTAKISESLGVSTWKVRQGSKELSINPRVIQRGLNSAYLQTRAIQDAVEIWDATLNKTVLANDGIAITQLENGQDWQISRDGGSTWIDVFIYGIPKERAGRWQLKFARGITAANLTVTYQIGQGTFINVDGNPVENTTSAQFTATVSQDRARTQFEDAPGLSPSRIFMQGYFANPTTQPAELQTMRPFPATLTTKLSDGTDGIAVDGFWITLNMAQDAWPNRRDERGDRIQGYFTSTGSGVS